MRYFRSVLVAVLLAFIAVPAVAQDKPKKEQRPQKVAQKQQDVAQRTPRIPFLQEWLADIELSEDQKTKLGEITKEFAPKFAELQKKTDAVFTEEQRRARQEAMQKARQEGKTGAELREQVAKVVTPTPEQREQLEKIQGQRKELTQKLREAVMSILTDEQKQAVQAKMKPAQAPRKKAQQ